MAIVTIFLTVLVVSLGIGNALLFLFKPQEPEIEPVSVKETASPVSSAPLEKKIELAHMRIQELEEKSKVSNTLTNTSDFEKMKLKMHKLDNFCSTAEAELIGMKEILSELQKKNVTVKSRAFKSNRKLKGKELSPKEMHKLIFKSS